MSDDYVASQVRFLTNFAVEVCGTDGARLKALERFTLELANRVTTDHSLQEPVVLALLVDGLRYRRAAIQ